MTTLPKKIKVTSEFQNSRLDKFLMKQGISFALAQKLIRQKEILVNQTKVSPDYRILEDDEIEIFGNIIFNKTPPKKTSKIDPKKLELIKNSIIYQDENLIAINKPSGISTQGGSGINFSIDDALPFLKFEKNEKPKLVHRLDKDTSGILLIARNSKAADLLTEGFRNKTIKKTYLAIVKGTVKKESGVINIPIIKKYQGKNEKVYRDDINGKEAITNYRIMENFGEYSLLELQPLTGRTHQLRVHLKEIGHPILGDGKYGGKNAFVTGMDNRLHLHAFKIVIEDFFGKEIKIETDFPDFVKGL